MKMRHACLFAAVVLIVGGLAAAGCAKRMTAANPQGNVTLIPPYAPDYPGAPDDKISVQYAVISVAKQTGIGYDWDTSFKNTDPVCRLWIRPTVMRQPFPNAMKMILDPVRLNYTIKDGKIVLTRIL